MNGTTPKFKDVLIDYGDKSGSITILQFKRVIPNPLYYELGVSVDHVDDHLEKSLTLTDLFDQNKFHITNKMACILKLVYALNNIDFTEAYCQEILDGFSC